MFNMRPAIRGCDLSVRRISEHAALGRHSLALGSRGLGSASRRGACRQLHLFSSGGVRAGISRAGHLDQATGSSTHRSPWGPLQTRSFRKANYVERIGDNERTEEILEALDVKDDEKDVPPQRQVTEEEKPPSEEETKKWSGDMTKGMLEHIKDHQCRLTGTGKMLTTPSRLFKLIIPLTISDNEGLNKGMRCPFMHCSTCLTKDLRH